jgi:hypothetical protein
MGYAHVRTGVRLDGSGRLSFDDSSKDVLGEGREVADVVLVSLKKYQLFGCSNGLYMQNGCYCCMDSSKDVLGRAGSGRRGAGELV